MWNKQSLQNFIAGKFAGYKIIVVSNREPYIHTHAGNQIECIQPASGMATALDPIMRSCGGVWIAHGSGSADRETVDIYDRVQVPPAEPRYTLRRVWLTQEQEERYYYGLANEGLWPLCHAVFKRPVFDPENWQAYREVNELFARAVLEEAGGKPTFVFIQDYHFALLPRLLKEHGSNLVVAQFWHIPWPNAETFRTFPWKEELLDGMLGNDLLGFHLRRDCQNFLDAVDCSLEARVDRESFEVIRSGKTTAVQPFPISIDFEAQSTMAASPAVDDLMECWRRRLNLNGGTLLGVGIDRSDYTKGIPERLRALNRFFEERPEYRGRVVFVQVAVPTRERIPHYKQLNDEVETLVDEINWRWSTDTWRPVILIREHLGPRQMMALHRLASFCMVTSLHDGMNLVAKEFVASRNDKDGVLILSRFTGAAREFTDAVLVNPFSEEETADAIVQALEMHPDERAKRMEKLRALTASNNVYRWAGKVATALLCFEFSKSQPFLVEQTEACQLASA